MDHGRCMEACPPCQSGASHAENAGSSTTKRAPAPCRTVSSESPCSGGPTGTLSQFGRPVAGPNTTAMSFDNLARNRQAQTRILAEALAWSVRVKSLKNALQRMRRDARPVIVDSDDHVMDQLLAFRLFSSGRAFKGNAHNAAGFGKRAGVAYEIGYDLRETGIVPEDKIVDARVLAAPDRNGQFDLGAAPRRNPAPSTPPRAEERRRRLGPPRLAPAPHRGGKRRRYR